MWVSFRFVAHRQESFTHIQGYVLRTFLCSQTAATDTHLRHRFSLKVHQISILSQPATLVSMSFIDSSFTTWHLSQCSKNQETSWHSFSKLQTGKSLILVSGVMSLSIVLRPRFETWLPGTVKGPFLGFFFNPQKSLVLGSIRIISIEELMNNATMIIFKQKDYVVLKASLLIRSAFVTKGLGRNCWW